MLKKKRRDRHFRKAAHQKIRVWTELQAQMEWIQWPKGGIMWLAASWNTCHGNLRVPLILLLSLWKFQMWGQLKKEVIWSSGIWAAAEGEEKQAAPQSLHIRRLAQWLGSLPCRSLGLSHISQVLLLWWPRGAGASSSWPWDVARGHGPDGGL